MNPFKRILSLTKIYRRFIGRRMYLVFILTTGAALAEGVGIILLLPLLGALDGDSPPDTGAVRLIYDALALLGADNSVLGILLVISFVFVTKGVLIFLQIGYQGYLNALLMQELKARMFDAYSGMDYRYYIQRNTGHFINVLNEQIDRFTISFKGFSSFLSSIVMTVGYMVMAFLIIWRFSLLAIGFSVVILMLFRFLNKYMRTLSRKTSSETGHLNKLLVQALQAFKYIASTNQIGHLRDGVMQSIQRLTRYKVHEGVANALTQAVREPVSILLIIGLVVVQVVLLETSVKPIIVVILLFHRCVGATITIQSSWQGVMSMVGSVETVDKEFNILEENQEDSGTRPVLVFSDGIELQNVSFTYNQKLDPVLKQLNVSIPVNTTIAIVGKSGAGKSTLIDLLTLLLKPQSGTLLIDGVPAQEVDLDSWRKQIGYVSQETIVFDDTFANNICLWQGDAASDAVLMGRIRKAARQAYIADYIETLPESYQTMVGDRGIRLSGGQRQRLFIARELFKQPNLLILDEATSALDTESERYIQESIDSLKGWITVVIIAHRLSTIRKADYVYVLEKGQVIEEGSYQKLTKKSGSRLGEMVAQQVL